MNNVINSFRKQYYFLSNFYMAPVTYNGCTFKNNEAAFQAQKCPNEMKAFCNMDPSEAKRYGRRVTLRKDWENVKFTIMYDIVYAKFTQNQDLKVKLLATGNAHLEEGNTWGDKTWGTVNGVGQNCLGKILMDVREYLRKEMEQTKALIVLERSNGMYGGYEMRNGRYVQLFNFSAEQHSNRFPVMITFLSGDMMSLLRSHWAVEKENRLRQRSVLAIIRFRYLKGASPVSSLQKARQKVFMN